MTVLLSFSLVSHYQFNIVSLVQNIHLLVPIDYEFPWFSQGRFHNDMTHYTWHTDFILIFTDSLVLCCCACGASPSIPCKLFSGEFAFLPHQNFTYVTHSQTIIHNYTV